MIMNQKLREEATKLGFPFDEFELLTGDDVSKLKNLCGKGFVVRALALLKEGENPANKIISTWIAWKNKNI